MQETPSSRGLELKHSQALCRVTRGRQGGTVPGLGLVSQASVLVSGFERVWKVLTGQSSFTPELWGCGSWQGEGRNLAGKPPLRLPAPTSQASSAPGAERWVSVWRHRPWSGAGQDSARGCCLMKWDWRRDRRLCVLGCAGPCSGRWPGEVFPVLV